VAEASFVSRVAAAEQSRADAEKARADAETVAAQKIEAAQEAQKQLEAANDKVQQVEAERDAGKNSRGICLREARISLGSFWFARADAGADTLIPRDQAPDPWL
jgi:hypothetical protein